MISDWVTKHVGLSITIIALLAYLLVPWAVWWFIEYNTYVYKVFNNGDR